SGNHRNGRGLPLRLGGVRRQFARGRCRPALRRGFGRLSDDVARRPGRRGAESRPRRRTEGERAAVSELPPRATAHDFVRPFGIAGGGPRAIAASLRLETMVQAAGTRRASLEFEAARIVDACLEPISVAELGAELRMPLGVVIVLVGDLVEAGCLETTYCD